MSYSMMVAAEGDKGWRWDRDERSDGGTRGEEGPAARGQEMKRVPRGEG